MKFRVWGKDQNKYLDKHNVHHLENNDGVFSIVLDMDMEKIAGKDRFEIEWSTGLFDDKGKEIYVGDIVRYGCNTDTYESVVAYQSPSFIGKNFFHEKIYGWKNAEWHVVWDRKGVEAFNQEFYRGTMSITNHNYITIIGNINENPELL